MISRLGLFILCWLPMILVGKTTEAPHAWMEQVEHRFFDEQGRLIRRLGAEKLHIYQADQRTHLQQPTMVLYQIDESPWHIRADQGDAMGGGDTLHLWSNVHLWQHNSETNETRHIDTDDLVYHPKTQRAHSDTWVRLRDPSSTVQAIGADFLFKEQRIELQSQARATLHSTAR